MNVTWSMLTREEQLQKSLAQAVKDKNLSDYQWGHWVRKRNASQVHRCAAESVVLAEVIDRLKDMLEGHDVSGETPINMGTIKTQFFKVLPTASSKQQ